MKREQIEIKAFCVRQIVFLFAMDRMRFAKIKRYGDIIHPITDRIEGKLLEVEILPWCKKLYTLILDKCIDDEGRSRRTRLINAGCVDTE